MIFSDDFDNILVDFDSTFMEGVTDEDLCLFASSSFSSSSSSSSSLSSSSSSNESCPTINDDDISFLVHQNTFQNSTDSLRTTKSMKTMATTNEDLDSNKDKNNNNNNNNSNNNKDNTSDINNHAVIRPKKKRKSYYIRKYPFPKLLKRDIRWDIPKIMTTVLNSNNDELINCFFRRMCLPSCSYVDLIPKYYEDPLRPIAFDLDTMINFIIMDSNIFPDLILLLNHAEIVQSEQFAGSKIVLYYDLTGTKMFTSAGQHKEKIRLPACTHKDIFSDDYRFEDYKKTDAIHLHFQPEDNVPLLVDQPMILSMSPKITIALDEDNNAYAIEYALTPGSIVTKTQLDSAFQRMFLS